MALTKEYREVVVLRYFGELSYEEIGETIGIPEKTVKSRLFSARQRLAEILAARRGRAEAAPQGADRRGGPGIAGAPASDDERGSGGTKSPGH
jgi:predicted DNA-binding protein (UPF0251 family)